MLQFPVNKVNYSFIGVILLIIVFCFYSEGAEALLRLTQMVQGMGNPLVAVYARCYLVRVGINVAPPQADKKYLLKNFTNFLDCYNHVRHCVFIIPPPSPDN